MNKIMQDRIICIILIRKVKEHKKDFIHQGNQDKKNDYLWGTQTENIHRYQHSLNFLITLQFLNK